MDQFERTTRVLRHLDQFERTIRVLLHEDVGGACHVVYRRTTAIAPYVTTFPRYKTYGDCKMGVPDATIIKTFTCEVRWPDHPGAWTVGDDGTMHHFVFVGTLVRAVGELTKRAVVGISKNSIVTFTDHWKPTTINGRINLQRLFTIEVRVDFRDEDKLPLFQQIIKQAGCHIYGQSGLLGDGVKPEIIIHSHDFYMGHSDIALFDDAVLAGDVAIAEAAVPPDVRNASPLSGGEPCPEGFSNELMAELKR